MPAEYPKNVSDWATFVMGQPGLIEQLAPKAAYDEESDLTAALDEILEADDDAVVKEIRKVSFKSGDSLIIWIPKTMNGRDVSDLHRGVLTHCRRLMEHCNIYLQILFLPENVNITVLSKEEQNTKVVGNSNPRGRLVEVEGEND